MVEIEVKVRVPDLKFFADALLRAGARLEKERYREENTLFDLRNGTLRQRHCALRLRQTGSKAFLTFKGTPQKSRRFKVRAEHETEIRDEKQMRQILRSLGFVAVFQYRKFRTVFRKGRTKVCLDETSVGNFAEFEGERSDIIKLARVLGFGSSDLIKRDYVELMQEAARSR
jgi:adenylate cyclase class 2